ncbi:MAG: glycosyltransferase family 2 protein [Candidatus Promineifilaceae bacterium]|nr:glycosyltransferase family 2 protein [Candidatus Promineifilaceae bacterium]
MIRLLLFWSSIGLILYSYFLFPFLTFLRGKFRQQPYRSQDITPKVSMIIAAYNEAEGIGAKLDNILSLDYPQECLEVVVASDGSNDGTDEIVRGYAAQRVRLLSLPRQGKAPALNSAVAASTGEILVFSDANSMYAPDAIRAIVRPFADPEVGGVAGNQVYLEEEQKDATSGEKSYWMFDRKLKQSQSQAGNAISATGAIYAIRRSLFQTVPDGVTDDFVTSTRVILQGYRLVFAPDAIAYEPIAKSSSRELGRKERVITRGLRSVWTNRALLNPLRYGYYSVQVFSHKILRRLAVFPLIALFLVSPLLWWRGSIYRLAALAQFMFYGFALIGALFDDTRIGRQKQFALPFFFCLVNLASLRAALNIMRGQRIDRWETRR